MVIFFFFFQAEDGIRDLYVTGVQTCALPIWPGRWLLRFNGQTGRDKSGGQSAHIHGPLIAGGGPRLGQARVSPNQIGRASCRERVKISVVAGSLKKKDDNT